MTADSSKLKKLVKYYGPETIMVGNRERLKIMHIGSTTLDFGEKKLKPVNVLVVSKIKQNLISVSQLTLDQPLNFEFFNDHFVIKNRESKIEITSGHRHEDLYVLKPWTKKALFSSRQHTINNEG